MLQDDNKTNIDHDQLLSEVSAMATQFDVLRFLKRITELFGARAFIVLRVPSATNYAIQAASVITNWPAELLNRFDAENLLQASETMRHIRTSSLPIRVDVNRPGEDQSQEKKEQFIALFEKFNMPRGAFFPVVDPRGDRGGIGFTGDRPVFSNCEILQLHMVCTHVFERLYHISKSDRATAGNLTQREIDCLNWTAAGKTSAEIADILTLSEHTVNHYLNRVTKKLDTVNRTHAVVKALRNGIIA